MLTRAAKIIAISVLALGTSAAVANADCGHRDTGTAVGAVGGGVVGNVITHMAVWSEPLPARSAAA